MLIWEAQKHTDPPTQVSKMRPPNFRFFANHNYLKRENNGESSNLCFEKENFETVILGTLNMLGNGRPLYLLRPLRCFPELGLRAERLNAAA
jgi:hypothetical protein